MMSEQGWWRIPGYADDKDRVLTRLRWIEGQVRGLQRLVDEDAYCIDVLTQISAVDKALKGVAVRLLDGHLRHCVRDGMATGGRDAEAIVAEATDAIARLVRA
jgi:CsoR family transcriptional regulator, copper-sensing transcriptional repressor